MTRAEREANKAYPAERTIIGVYSTGGFMTKDFSEEKRLGFIEGYEPAEKDLALTWKDIQRIVEISDELVECMEVGIIEPYLANEQTFYEEVLRRFNKTKQ